jgi:hypothetical protein
VRRLESTEVPAATRRVLSIGIGGSR